MKKWESPALSELKVRATAYAPESGTKIDGYYDSYDGVYQNVPSYGPSGEDHGNPEVDIEANKPQ